MSGPALILPCWTSGCKCDCRTRGLGFDSHFGQAINGLGKNFSIVARSLELCPVSGNSPITWDLYHKW
ncbi:hypothetical protein SFRURICE_002190 [Spodoptera frugiperda]|nr:hypothetical protein SFRURICE_002190 [Spodoptera frugiperda]